MPIMVYVDKYSVSPYDIQIGTRGSVGIEILQFTFSPEWDGLQKRITFYANDRELAAAFCCLKMVFYRCPLRQL